MTPSVLRVFVGFGCNNHCVFCAQGDERERGLEVLVGQALEQVRSGQSVVFVGGEPTTYEDLCDWVGGARERGAARVVLQTNGRRLADPEYCGRIARSGVSGLDVSLQGETAAMHDFHTRVPGSFRQTVQGIRNSRAMGLSIGVSTVITRANYRHLSGIVRLDRSLGARAVNLMVAARAGHAEGAAVVPPAALVKPHLARALRLAHQFGLEYVAGALRSGPAVRDRFGGIGVRTGAAELAPSPRE